MDEEEVISYEEYMYKIVDDIDYDMSIEDVLRTLEEGGGDTE